MVAQVGVVTTIGCPYCKKAKQALKDQGVQYDEAELGSARDVLKQVKETTGQGTVPQV
jgi:glutathione-dependent peroxiredoxin